MGSKKNVCSGVWSINIDSQSFTGSWGSWGVWVTVSDGDEAFQGFADADPDYCEKCDRACYRQCVHHGGKYRICHEVPESVDEKLTQKAAAKAFKAARLKTGSWLIDNEKKIFRYSGGGIAGLKQIYKTRVPAKVLKALKALANQEQPEPTI